MKGWNNMKAETRTKAAPTVVHDTFVLERNFSAAPERVFAAFADPEKKRRWFLQSGGNEEEQFNMDFRTGGQEQVRFRFKDGTPVAGLVCTNDTLYMDIVTNRRVVFSSTMTIGGQRISASLVTAEMLASGSGTDLILTHQAAFFEGADGPAMRQEGWRKLLERLSAEVSS
jgi:uncharacterized protein YndB with AHSA1/START domain